MGLRSYMRGLGERIHSRRIEVQCEGLRRAGVDEDLLRYAAEQARREWSSRTGASHLQRAFYAEGEERKRILAELRSRMMASRAFERGYPVRTNADTDGRSRSS